MLWIQKNHLRAPPWDLWTPYWPRNLLKGFLSVINIFVLNLHKHYKRDAGDHCVSDNQKSVVSSMICCFKKKALKKVLNDSSLICHHKQLSQIIFLLTLPPYYKTEYKCCALPCRMRATYCMIYSIWGSSILVEKHDFLNIDILPLKSVEISCSSNSILFLKVVYWKSTLSILPSKPIVFPSIQNIPYSP